MQPRIITVEAKKLIGQSIDMSLVNNKTFELFSGFMPNKAQITNAMSQDVYEVMVYDDAYFKTFNPNTNFTKWGALEVDGIETIPEGMKSYVLEGGLYAIFNYKGLSQDFSKLMQHIMMVWLPQSDYRLDDRPHFNVLGEKYKRDDPNSEETVFIPIKLA